MSDTSSAIIESITDLLEKLKDLKWMEEPHAHTRSWFRGQSDSSYRLLPGVYRSNFRTAAAAPFADEVSRLKVEQQMSQDFRVLSASIRRGDETDAQLYFLQQHHGMPTRLLDWSSIPLIALFMAVSKKSETDGVLYAMDAYELGKQQKAEFIDTRKSASDYLPLIGIATSIHPAFTQAMVAISNWHSPDQMPGYIIPVQPDHLATRISLQRSYFTFHGLKTPELTKEVNNTLCLYTIPAARKDSIRRELSKLGIDDFSIYGDLDHLARKLRASYCSGV